MAKPVVYEYLDYLRFLNDWYQWRKESPGRMTHRTFSKQAQLSLGYLTNVLNGTRIPEDDALERLVIGMSLDAESGAFFMLLVRLSRAVTWQARCDILGQIFENPRFQEADAIPSRRLEYLSRWYYVAMRELENLPEYQEDPEWIQKKLLFQVSLDEIKHGLDLLHRWRVTQELSATRLQTPHLVAHTAAFAYHHSMMGLAQQALETTSSESRCFQASTLSVPEELVPLVTQEIQRFIVQISNLCDHPPTPTAPASNIYQIQVQFFPLTR